MALKQNYWIKLNCGKKYNNCPVTGFLPELLNSVGHMFNFSVVYHKQKERKYGLIPVNGN